MGMCTCGFTTNPEGKCNGTHNFVKKVREKIADELWQRHLDGGIGGTEWTNHHGLERCDCEDMVKWVREQ